MGQTYAAILGSLAMITVIVRGLMHNGGVESTFLNATTSLIAFAIIGWVVGSIAETTVDEAVRSKMQVQLEEFETESGTNA